MSLAVAFWTDWRRWIWIRGRLIRRLAIIQAAKDKCRNEGLEDGCCCEFI